MSGSSGSQCSQAREVHRGISPVLIKQFSVYEPLKPQKVINSPSSSLNEDLLIDFESPVEVNRTPEKEEFNVIDLFQNIYVTPQLVNNKPKTKTETDVDYEDFLRKLESRNKDSAHNSKIVPLKNSLLDFDFEQFTENRPLANNNDSNTNSLSMTSFNHEAEEYQEDLIEEILLERTLEKMKISDVNGEQTSKKLRVLSTPKLSNMNIDRPQNAINFVAERAQDSKTDHYWKRDNVPTSNLYYGHEKKDRSIYLNENIAIKTLPHNKNSAITSKISNNISNNQSSPDYQTRCLSEKSFNLNAEHNNIKACFSAHGYYNEDTIPVRNYTHLNDINHQRKGSLNNERILHLHTPQQNHHVTHDYINLYAKSDLNSNDRTIPMRNDNDKSDHSLNYNENVTNHANVNITPKITSSDYLKELKSAVNHYQSKSYFVSDITTLVHLSVDPGEMMSVPVQAVIKDNKEYAKSPKTKSNTEKLTYTKGPDLTEKCIVLPQLLSRLSAQKVKRDAKNNVKKRLLLYSDGIDVKTGQDQATVELKPSILMEDCNRERLIALNTRQRLSNLVESGNIF